MSVAILADDLTGALDAAAPFAPVRLVRRGLPPVDVSIALDSSTREGGEGAAIATIARLLPMLAGRNIAFKKMDSLLRGNTMAEIATCWHSGRYRSMVVAPAFPLQGRVTRKGRQYVLDAGGWTEAGSPGESLLARGVPLRNGPPFGEGAFLCDAETDADLATIAAAPMAEPVLWCGSGGLAAALAGPGQQPVAACGRCRLIVIGTRHPATAAQLSVLVREHPDVIVAPADIVRRLAHRETSVLALQMPPSTQEDALRILGSATPPDMLVVTGGSTLARLCDALNVDAIECIGAWRSGFPVGRLIGGAWEGVSLVSKSGAFGAPTALLDLVKGRSA